MNVFSNNCNVFQPKMEWFTKATLHMLGSYELHKQEHHTVKKDDRGLWEFVAADINNAEPKFFNNEVSCAK